MPRDAAGNFTLVSGNPVSTGTTIESNWANTTLDDVGDSLTNSLSRLGQGGMLANWRGIDGTETLPAYAFTSDIGSGLYLESVGTLAWSCDSSKKLSVSASEFRVHAADAYVEGSLICDSSMTAASVYCEGRLDVLGTAYTQAITASGSTNLQALAVNQVFTAFDTANLSDDLNVGGNVLIDGALTADGIVNLGDDVNVGGDVQIDGALTVDGAVTVGGAITYDSLSVTNDVDIGGTLEVTGAIDGLAGINISTFGAFGGNVGVQGRFDAYNDAYFGTEINMISGTIINFAGNSGLGSISYEDGTTPVLTGLNINGGGTQRTDGGYISLYSNSSTSTQGGVVIGGGNAATNIGFRMNDDSTSIFYFDVEFNGQIDTLGGLNVGNFGAFSGNLSTLTRFDTYGSLYVHTPDANIMDSGGSTFRKLKWIAGVIDSPASDSTFDDSHLNNHMIMTGTNIDMTVDGTAYGADGDTITVSARGFSGTTLNGINGVSLYHPNGGAAVSQPLSLDIYAVATLTRITSGSWEVTGVGIS